MIELFAQKKAPEKKVNSDPIEEVKKIEKISHLSKEKRQTVELILGKLRLSASALVEAFLSADASTLNEGA